MTLRFLGEDFVGFLPLPLEESSAFLASISFQETMNSSKSSFHKSCDDLLFIMSSWSCLASRSFFNCSTCIDIDELQIMNSIVPIHYQYAKINHFSYFLPCQMPNRHIQQITESFCIINSFGRIVVFIGCFDIRILKECAIATFLECTDYNVSLAVLYY